MTSFTPSAGHRRAATAFILVTILLDVLSLGVIIPVFPKLVEQLAGGETARAAAIYGAFGTVWALMQFVCSPVLGALSDRFGRRRVILISCFGLGFDYFLMAVSPTLAWLFLGRIISGITAASFATAGAYIADVTPPERRAASFGMIGAAWGVGFVLGPALGGVLGELGLRLPFWVAGGLTLANAFYGLFILPESLPPERREPFAWRRANPVGSLKLLRSHTELLGLAGVNLLYLLAHHVLPSVFVLYTSWRYGWSERTMGLTLAAVGVFNIVVQGGLVRPIVTRLGERRTLFAGIVTGAVGFAVFGLAPTERVFWATLPVFAFMGLFGPAVQGLMTRRVSPSEQGQLQGANTSMMGLTGLVGPGMFTLTFAYFIDGGARWNLPGASFLLASLLMVMALALAWRVTRPTAPSPLAPLADQVPA